MSKDKINFIKKKISKIFNKFYDGFDEEELLNTPERISRMYCNEYFSGLKEDPKKILKTFKSDNNELIVQKDIPFCSTCAHHLVPFRGVVHIAYIPNGKIVGLSKLGRLVDIFSKRPQLQEKLTKQIADCLMENLEPLGVGVIIKAEHMCLTTRGAQKVGSLTLTSAMRGEFFDNNDLKNEFLKILSI